MGLTISAGLVHAHDRAEVLARIKPESRVKAICSVPRSIPYPFVRAALLERYRRATLLPSVVSTDPGHLEIGCPKIRHFLTCATFWISPPRSLSTLSGLA